MWDHTFSKDFWVIKVILRGIPKWPEKCEKWKVEKLKEYDSWQFARAGSSSQCLRSYKLLQILPSVLTSDTWRWYLKADLKQFQSQEVCKECESLVCSVQFGTVPFFGGEDGLQSLHRQTHAVFWWWIDLWGLWQLPQLMDGFDRRLACPLPAPWSNYGNMKSQIIWECLKISQNFRDSHPRDRPILGDL